MSILCYKAADSSLVPLTGCISGDFYITHEQSGEDSLCFCVETDHPEYRNLEEETVVVYGDNDYVIKKIQDDKFEAKLNLDFMKSVYHMEAKTASLTLVEQLQNILGQEWSIEFYLCSSSIRRTIEVAGKTDYDLMNQLMSTYSVFFEWHTLTKHVVIHGKANEDPSGQYITSELNLRSLSFQGETTSLVTVIYPEGKEGVGIKGATVSDELIEKYGLQQGVHYNASKKYLLDYVTCFKYTDKRLCAQWKDERYTIKENLLEDALERVFEYGLPARSYECDVVDLAKQSEKYSFLAIRLHAVMTLLDPSRGIGVDHRVVQYIEYPDEHDLDKVVLSRVPSDINASIQQIASKNEEYVDSTKSALELAIIRATSLISGNEGGYVVIHDTNGDDLPDEILIMSQPDISAANNKIWRFNKNGLGYSSTGYNGEFATAITADGEIVASFITAGVLNGALIQGGTVRAEALTQEYKESVAQDISTATATIASTLRQEFSVADGQVLSQISQTLQSYSTTSEMNTAISGAVSNRPTVTEMNSAISQTASEITTEVNKKVNNSDFGTKITQNYSSVRIAWNNCSNYIQFESGELNIYSSASRGEANRLMKLNSSGMWFYHKSGSTNKTVGKIGTNHWTGNDNYRGLVFDLENDASYMCWAAKDKSTDSLYTVKLAYYHKTNGNANVGLHFCCRTYANGNLYLDGSHNIVQWVNDYGTVTGVGYGGQFTFYGMRYNSDTQKTEAYSYFKFDSSNFTAYNYASVNFYTNIHMNGYDIYNQSDARLKENLVLSNIDALSILNAVDMYSFDWIESGDHEALGIIAQQLQSVAPDLVGTDAGGYLNIKTTKLVYYLVKAVQQLSSGSTWTKAPFNESDYTKITPLAPTGAGPGQPDDNTIAEFSPITLPAESSGDGEGGQQNAE